MADIFLNSVDGNDADDGSTWALAKATLATGIAAVDTTNQRVCMDSAHAETAASITYASPGTVAAPCQLLSVTQTGAAGISALTAGATFTANSGSTGMTFNGSYYAYGISFVLSTTSATGMFFGAGSSTDTITLDTCNISSTGSGSSSTINFGNQSTYGSKNVINNCTFRFGATGQRITYAGEVEINGGGWSASGTLNPTNVFEPQSTAKAAILTVNGFDFSNLNAAINLTKAQAGAKAIFRNCKLPASWTGKPIADANVKVGFRAEMYNCDSGSTNYKMWVRDAFGDAVADATVYNDAGATDGTTRLSWKITTTANIKYPCSAFVSPEIMIWNDTTGSAKTATVEIVHDGASAFTDTDVWLEVQYLGDSGDPKSSFVSDVAANVITTAAAQATSAASWTGDSGTGPNGSSTWNQLKLVSPSFTPQKKGYIIARVCMALPSKTIYVDPLITIA